MKTNLITHVIRALAVLLLSCVSALAAPSISTQPLAQTKNQGQSASFSVAATGAGTLTYQWQKDGVNIPSATGSTYNIASAQPQHIGYYTCRVSDSVGSVTSQQAALNINGVAFGVWQGLVAYYKLNNTASDLTVFNNIGTGEGVIFTGDRFGSAFSSCAVTNEAGTSNRIRCGNPQSGIFDFTDTASISIWIKPSSNLRNADGQSLNALISKDEGPGYTNKWIVSVYPNKIGIYIRISNQAEGFVYSDNVVFSADKWSLVTVSKTGRTFNFYLDGQPAGFATHSLDVPKVNSEMTLGWAESPFNTKGLSTFRRLEAV